MREALERKQANDRGVPKDGPVKEKAHGSEVDRRRGSEDAPPQGRRRGFLSRVDRRCWPMLPGVAKRVVLHIGAMKSGTSFIQNVLDTNRAASPSTTSSSPATAGASRCSPSAS